MLSFLTGHTPQAAGFISRTPLGLSSLRPKLHVRSSQEARTAFPLCDLQGGSLLLLRHLLRRDPMFSPSNELAPTGCREKAQSSSNGKRDPEGKELALALAGSSLPSDQVCHIPSMWPTCFLICPLPFPALQALRLYQSTPCYSEVNKNFL